MAKARRKMRRALMKKMKKGKLSPRERRELMELDREVNRANRQAAGIGGAGLAAALAIASKTGALKKGKDALGDFLDTRKARKDGQDIAEAKLDMEMMRREDLMDGLPKGKDSESASQKEIKKRMKAIEGIEIEGEEEEDFADEQLDADLKKYREDRMNDLEQALGSNAALASMFGRGEAPPPASSIRPVGPGPKYDAGEGRTFDEIMDARRADPPEENERLDKRLERRGGFDPRTGEYVDSAKQRAADEEFDREFDESLPDAEVMEIARLYNEGRREEAERLAAQVLTPEQQQMERFRNRTAVQALRGRPTDIFAFDSAQARRFRELFGEEYLGPTTSDYTGGFETTGERPGFSSSSLRRSDGPRVDNADGGNTPFLRQMRDRIRKKFR